MSEKTELAEKKPVAVQEKPKKFWDGALKMVRGESTTQLIENFTAEMTLVAEGLCEDQGNLRRDVDKMVTEEDRRIQAIQTRVEAAETSLEEERRAHDRDLTELRNRLAALEKQAANKPAVAGKEKNRKGTIIRDLTVLIAIAAGAWIIVTVINKFF